jgi:hypothetical protein
MLHDTTKSQGLLRLLTQGLFAHSEKETLRQLGDRTGYIGMSDIGKGMECLRAAVASKLGIVSQPAPGDLVNLSPQDLAKTLERQIPLQRGHWQEAGIQQALQATGVKLVPQLAISVEHNGVPIQAHLDFTLVWGGQRPAVRILELKSNGHIPESLYASYEAQLYGQVGLLKTCWSQRCFAVGQDSEQETFPEIMHRLFGVVLPVSPDTVDIEAWVLSISMSKVKPFGPYVPDNAMLGACLDKAEAIWQAKSDVLAGTLTLNDLDVCQGFHPLCDWCEVNNDCPRFTGSESLELDPACGMELEELAMLKERRTALEERIADIEEAIRKTYRLAKTRDWLSVGSHRFRVAAVAGRKTLDRHLLAERLTVLLGDDLKAQALLEQCEKSGKPFERLFVSPINQPVKSAA